MCTNCINVCECVEQDWADARLHATKIATSVAPRLCGSLRGAQPRSHEARLACKQACGVCAEPRLRATKIAHNEVIEGRVVMFWLRYAVVCR